MKKRNVIISCAAICTIVCAILVLILHKSTSDSIEVKPFMLNQYRRELSSFSTDKQVGKIVDERDVLEKAERIFLETFQVETKPPTLLSGTVTARYSPRAISGLARRIRIRRL